MAGTGGSRRVRLRRNRFACPPGPETGQQAGYRQRDWIPVPNSDLGHQLQHVLAFARPQVHVARNPGVWGIQDAHQPRKEAVGSHVQHCSRVSPPGFLGTGLRSWAPAAPPSKAMTPRAIFIIWQIPLQGTPHSLLNGPQDKSRRRKRRVSVWRTVAPILA